MCVVWEDLRGEASIIQLITIEGLLLTKHYFRLWGESQKQKQAPAPINLTFKWVDMDNSEISVKSVSM